jgi:hypothetical protein
MHEDAPLVSAGALALDIAAAPRRIVMRCLTALIAACVLAAPAFANDSTAELATGGLVLTKSETIQMRAEDLFISATEIRVRYRFLNTSGQDVTTLVAFPMPDIAVEGPDSNIAVPTDDPENFLAFTTTVEGKPVKMRLEQKALVKGVDHTALLRKLGIPLAPHLASTNEALDRLPRKQWDELVGLGLATVEQYDIGKGMEDHLVAAWTLQSRYFWQQTFAAGRELAVEHRYQPSVGASVQTSVGDPEHAKEEWHAEYERKYCMDRAFLTAIARARRMAGTEFGSPFSEERIAYVLTTGANWAGPIREFRLTVDKGDPGNLVSFCGEGVKKVGPTRFEMRKTDFTPARDFYVLILKPLPKEQ